ncbi:MAG TPA: FAD-binding domain [Polyangiaceae bacterium]|jgi:2-polyprenyl-6-methoxyphenol hydroxylase-like FAD-dependent oxidoreductase
MRVAINGIGVAGPSLAYWLQQFGHEPVLFEKAPALRSGGYLIDFWGLGYELAERMGILPALLERCYRMDRLSMVDSNGREVAAMDVGPMRREMRGRFISLARADLAAALFDACWGVESHFGVSITGIEQDEQDIVATLSDGRRERFDLVVGADGLHSQVRQIAFGPDEQFETSLGCHVAAFRLPGYPKRDELTYVSHTVPKRQVARVSLRDEETLVLLVCRSELIDGEPTRERQKPALRRAFEDMKWEVPEILDRMDQVDDLYFDRVCQVHMPRWSTGRVALLGDAAACASLLAGEGTGLAMIEGYVLAGELHRTRGDVAAGLAAYEARLRSFVAAKQKAALRFRGFFAPESRFALKVRNVAVSTMSVPFIVNQLVARSLRDDLQLPDYAC